MSALRRIAPGVLVHESEFLQSHAVVVEGREGVLLIDPGITGEELAAIAAELRERDLPVVAGFSTHPDWDHLLWHPDLSDAPRYGTARCAATIAEVLTHPDWEAEIAEGLPPEHIDDIPTHLLGRIEGLPEGTTRIPWDGPAVRIIEHRGHAPGHAALLIEEARVLVAGDMLSDILMPFLDPGSDAPIDDYLAALDLLGGVAGEADLVVPGHGSVGDAAELRARIALDRAYAEALHDGHEPEDPRVGPDAPLDWLPDIHRWQVHRLLER